MVIILHQQYSYCSTEYGGQKVALQILLLKRYFGLLEYGAL